MISDWLDALWLSWFRTFKLRFICSSLRKKSWRVGAFVWTWALKIWMRLVLCGGFCPGLWIEIVHTNSYYNNSLLSVTTIDSGCCLLIGSAAVIDLGFCLLIMSIVATIDLGCYLLIGMAATIDLGCCLLFGIAATIDFGCRLLNGIAGTVDLGCCLLIGIATTTDFRVLFINRNCGYNWFWCAVYQSELRLHLILGAVYLWELRLHLNSDAVYQSEFRPQFIMSSAVYWSELRPWFFLKVRTDVNIINENTVMHSRGQHRNILTEPFLFKAKTRSKLLTQ